MTVEYRDPKDLKESEYSRKLFPKLEGKQYELLLKDIKKNGIETPLSITKDNVVLRGNERLRCALELGLDTVPVTIFGSDNEINQKIHIVIDNVARKSVDFETKFKCFQELKNLYGLKRGEAGRGGKEGVEKRRSEERYLEEMSEQELNEALKQIDEDKFDNLWKSLSFEERRETLKEEREYLEVEEEETVMTEEEIAKETGISKDTFERGLVIQKSKELPETIKKAVFKGELPVRPVVELLEKSKETRKEVIKRLEEQLEEKEGGKVQVASIIREVEEEPSQSTCGIPPTPPIEEGESREFIVENATFPKCCPSCPFYENCSKKR